MERKKINPTPAGGLLPIEVLCAYGPWALDVMARDERGRYHFDPASTQNC